MLLALVSLLVVYSSTGLLAYRYNKGNTEIYLFKQVMFITIGVAIIYFAHRVNYTMYSRWSRILISDRYSLTDLYIVFWREAE